MAEWRLQRPLLAAGAAIVAGGAAVSGTVEPVVALMCTVALPITITRSPRWSVSVATTVGFSYLLLLVDLAFSLQGHDLRYALADALLSVAGLHAARIQTNRDHLVAIGIQLAVLACGLSQLGTAGSAQLGAPLWVAGWLAVVLPQLRHLGDEKPAAIIAGPADRRLPARRYGLLAAVVLVAAILWSIIPLGGPKAPDSFGGDSGIAADNGNSDLGSHAGAARVGLSDSGVMDLSTRGSGSDRPVLVVQGEPALWRAEVFDFYDGASFSRTATMVPDSNIGQPVTPEQLDVPADAGDLSSTTQITVETLADQNTLISTGQPLSIEGPVLSSQDTFGDFYEPGVREGVSYTVVGGAPGAGAHAAVTPPDSATWLQLPAELPASVRSLAKTWTAGADGPTAQVNEIENHLQHDGYTYSLTSPVPAKGADAVADMLFRSKQGFCEQYAASTAILLRTLGIPARVVAGYAYGEPQGAAFGQLVRDSDAHAWVEYWQPGAGWLTADPTAGIPLAQHKSAATKVPVWVWIVAAAVVLLLALIDFFRRRLASLFRREGSTPQRVSPQVVTVADAFGALLAALASTGAARQPSETPADVLLRVPGGWDHRAAVLPALERSLWGPSEPDPADAAVAVAALDALTEAVRSAALLESV